MCHALFAFSSVFSLFGSYHPVHPCCTIPQFLAPLIFPRVIPDIVLMLCHMTLFKDLVSQ